MNRLDQNNSAQILVFTLDEPRYALYLSAVARVVRLVEILPLPKAPEIVLGVVDVQGKIVPVIDVRKRFRLPKRVLKLQDRLIIARTARRLVALTVDSVVGVIELRNREIVSSAQVLPFAGYIRAVARVHDDLVLIYDLDGFLSLDEAHSVDGALSEYAP